MPTSAKFLPDLIVTIIIWTYFTLGYMIFFFPFTLLSYIFIKDRQAAFQKINCRFYKGFFFILKTLIPGMKIDIQKEIFSIRASVIVINHLSYLDPLLMISLLEKHKTLVRADLFRIPLFGWMLKGSGYFPSTTGGAFDQLLIKNIEEMPAYLASGGNLFIFPEGTRSRDGRLGDFNKGAFSIARRCQAPLEVLRISNTGRIFKPDKFLFNTAFRGVIRVERLATLTPDYKSSTFSLSQLMADVRSLYDR